MEPRRSAEGSGRVPCKNKTSDMDEVPRLSIEKKKRNGGATAASLCYFAMVNNDCRLKHLPTPPDTVAGEVERGVSVLLLHSTLPCALPSLNLSL
ncbi:unnamed protein product [Menidia menidia]|uniref:(Atlantic silverside) hypothetical protein n=1 Tax=Menidia menidia TaxID=238744 RepID=A0A8S4AF31_9TELE|nr:unnamed protein product [Menidia menidia]